MILNLAHELRHLWQFEYHCFDKDYIPYGVGVDLHSYYFQDAEIDADAFSCIYFEERYAIDPIKYYFDYKPIFNNPIYAKAIIKRIQSIRNAA